MNIIKFDHKIFHTLLIYFLILILVIFLGVISNFYNPSEVSPVKIPVLFLILFGTVSYFLLYSHSIQKHINEIKNLAEENYDIKKITQQIIDKTNLQMPLILVVKSAIPNAFAVEHGGNSTIFVTKGLLNILNNMEIQSVISHEIAHLGNWDTWSRKFLLWLVQFGPFTSFFYLPLLKRQEYIADKMSSLLVGDSNFLISALKKINDLNLNDKYVIGENNYHKEFVALNPLLFSHINSPEVSNTHPKIQDRIERLKTKKYSKFISDDTASISPWGTLSKKTDTQLQSSEISDRFTDGRFLLILPLIFGILGGMVSYVILKHKNLPLSKKNLVWGIMCSSGQIATVLGILIIMTHYNLLYVIENDNMSPTINELDSILVDKSINFNEIRTGDMIVYQNNKSMDGIEVGRVIYVNKFPASLIVTNDREISFSERSTFWVSIDLYVGKVTNIIPFWGHLSTSNIMWLFIGSISLPIMYVMTSSRFSLTNR